MTLPEFNQKWRNRIEDRFRGLEINDPKVIDYLDKEFEMYVMINPQFEFSQIKIKFGFSRVYTNADAEMNIKWENQIDVILNGE